MASLRRIPLFFLLIPIVGLFAACASAPKHTKNTHRKPVHHYKNIDDLIYSVNETNHAKVKGKVRYGTNRSFDIPVVLNDRVHKWVDYFTGSGRGFFNRSLARSGRFFPYYFQVASQYGLPKDIAFLSLIESGLNTRATSWASAVGPWQFIRSTGANYGLQVDYYIDERRDIEKSTHAAFRHLADLHKEFGDWYLAFAAYNAGAGKVKRAIEKYGTTNFWELCEGSYFRPETKDYVPKILAAAIVGKNPHKYGFTNIESQVPLATEKMRTSESIGLDNIAQAAGVEEDLVYLLNPELYRGVTPPYSYQVKVPRGTAVKVAHNLDRVRDRNRPSRRMVRYEVAKGDTLKSVAKRYGVSTRDIVANNSKKTIKHLKRGTDLLIPQAGEGSGWSLSGASTRDDLAALRARRLYGLASGYDPSGINATGGGKKKVESVLLASKKDKLKQEVNPENVQKFASLNLNDNNPIATEEKTSEVASNPAPLSVVSTEASGNLALADFDAEQVQVSPAVLDNELKNAVAQLESTHPIVLSEANTGSLTTKPTVNTSKPARKIYHKVKKGETLTLIAKRYDTNLNALMQANGKSAKNLKYGTVLTIPSDAKTGPVVQLPKIVAKAKTKNVKAHYRVKHGDTLIEIARTNGTTVQKIMKTNGMKSSTVKIGSLLKI
ncbi:MAG: LysM peptidoglycan-binding domain-containing protein [Deltaproteobacteria bacterium]|nr:LysM peptidoglycan-binding domain-containing protein [Deltaproteobacteria bacterium]